jgi:hypothetical protein
LLPVILSSPNDPIVTLSWIGGEIAEGVASVVTVVVVFDPSELFIDIPGPWVAVVEDCKEDCNSCRSS